jgi:hypothetical protein
MFLVVGFLVHQILSIIRSQIEIEKKKIFSKDPCKFKEMLFTIEQSKEITCVSKNWLNDLRIYYKSH